MSDTNQQNILETLIEAVERVTELRKVAVHTIVYHPSDFRNLRDSLVSEGWAVDSEYIARKGVTSLKLFPMRNACLRGEFVTLKGDESVMDAALFLYRKERDNEKRTDDITRRYVRLPD